MSRLVLGLMVAFSSMVANVVSIEVTNIKDKNGTVFIGLYDKEDVFKEVSKVYKGQVLEIGANVVRCRFEDIPNGTYSISVFHDENGNSKLDKNFFGVPKEGYGFSNNIRHLLRGANFEESSFEIASDKNISIKMGY